MKRRQMRIYSSHTRRDVRRNLRHTVYVINLILMGESR